MRVDELPLKCPVTRCVESYDHLSDLAKHIFKLAEWHMKLKGGVGLQQRENHYKWVTETQRIRVDYDSIKNRLESLKRLGLLEEV